MACQPYIILLVEDNPDHAELIMRSLEGHKMIGQVYHVADGETALDYLFRQQAYSDPVLSPRPDLVLLDLRLPKINGQQVLKEIKNADDLSSIPVVILTSSDLEQDIDEAYVNHANSYLVKPLDFHKFAQLMNDMGAYWLRWNVRHQADEPDILSSR